MTYTIADAARRFFGVDFADLARREQAVVGHFVRRQRTSRDIGRALEERLTLGEKLADRVAAFGGSWAFILFFSGVLLCWVALNSWLLPHVGEPSFDPYPYILLNLVLSMLAAFQAPVILMSQNRQAAKDRATAAHDYEVNLKAEMEIMLLHEKLDALRQQQLDELLRLQTAQLDLLRELMDGRARSAPTE
jgi:uncharacterized membrane protein